MGRFHMKKRVTEKLRQGKGRQLKWSMISMLIMCWFIPLSVLTFSMLFIVSNRINKQIENTVITSSDKAVEICQLRIAEAITASRNASYLPTIKESYTDYQEDHNSQKLYHDITLFLNQQYKYNTDIKSAIIYLVEQPEILYYTYYNASGATYESIQAFKRSAKEQIQEEAQEIDTSVVFMKIDDHIYMVRNIVDSKFNPIAVIVLELNTQNIFGGLESIWGYQEANVFVDGQTMFGEARRDLFADQIKQRTLSGSYYYHENGNYYVYSKLESDRHKMSYVVKLDENAILSESKVVQYLFFIFVVFMAPLVILILWFFHKKVTLPIKQLVSAYHEIEGENYGYQINTTSNNQEFYYLDQAFNRMSDKLQYQFQKIYLEELALRDANIMALQSQINPHFLNNTLEIINWEARMADNYKVTGMIEALSTMLEATLNRKSQPLISLAEELSYVDAYLYIIKQRFGDNFEFQKSVDDYLLRTEVPRLIIQPIIENAVEHGMDIQRKGRVSLHIYKKDDKLYIEVMDNGRLTGEDKKRIEQLLSTEEHNVEAGSISLGIRNVNKRLRIIYGEDCGLYIHSNAEGYTVSTIIVRCTNESAQ